MKTQKINLLPEEVRPKKTKTPLPAHIKIISVGIFALILVITFSLAFIISYLEKNIDGLEVEHRRAKAIIGEESRAQTEKQDLEKKIGNLYLDPVDFSWRNLLEGIRDGTPEQVGLEEIKGQSRGQLFISGNSGDYESIGTFLDSLQSIPQVRTVILKNIQEKETHLYEFEISCDLGVRENDENPDEKEE
ncbi:MAG: PilN domain-containing protein [Clostridia bacterium]|nr:PilN domain-containing protein [Clostridia bacterium]